MGERGEGQLATFVDYPCPYIAGHGAGASQIWIPQRRGLQLEQAWLPLSCSQDDSMRQKAASLFSIIGHWDGDGA